MFRQVLSEDIADFFTALGYKYGWDTCGGKAYHEITTQDNEIVMQFDEGIPLTAIVEDLFCLKEGREPSSPYDYVMNAALGCPKFQALLEKLN